MAGCTTTARKYTHMFIDDACTALHICNCENERIDLGSKFSDWNCAFRRSIHKAMRGEERGADISFFSFSSNGFVTQGGADTALNSLGVKAVGNGG